MLQIDIVGISSNPILPEANAQFDYETIDLKILDVDAEQPNIVKVKLNFQNNGESFYKPDSQYMYLILAKPNSSAEDLSPDSKSLILDNYNYSHPEKLGMIYPNSDATRECDAIDFSIRAPQSERITICFELSRQGNSDILTLIENDQLFFKLGNSCPNCKIMSLKDIFDPTIDFLSYSHTALGIKIKYPSEWTKDESGAFGELVSFYSPFEDTSDEFSENVQIGVDILPDGVNLQQFVDFTIQSSRAEIPDFRVVESSRITLDEKDANQLVVVWTFENIKIKQMMIFMIEDKKAYSFVYTAKDETYSSYLITMDDMLDSLEIGQDIEKPITPMIMPQVVIGKYVNSQAGMEMEFPNELTGFEITLPKDMDYSELPVELQGMAEMYSGMTMVMMLPAESDPTENIEMMMLTIMETSSIETFSEFISQTVESGASQSSIDTDLGIKSQPECDISNQTILEINEMKSVKIDSECYDPTENMTVIMSIYMFVTPQYVISPMYIIVQETDKQNDLSIFENSLNTLNIENTIDISDPNSYAELFGLKITQENIVIENKSHEIDIVSDSTISNFSFDETNYTMSFESEGGLTLASTEIYLDNALMEPFTVTIDGSVDDTFMITKDNTTGQTSIAVSYFHPVEKISIKGNKANVLSDTLIPDWIRNNASWWVAGNIDDDAFVGGIQFLIKEGIIQIPETSQSTTSDGSQEIPAWIKNNADWWSQGLISDTDFLKGITFLVENGIITV